jgi:hypothetical protein
VVPRIFRFLRLGRVSVLAMVRAGAEVGRDVRVNFCKEVGFFFVYDCRALRWAVFVAGINRTDNRDTRLSLGVFSFDCIDCLEEVSANVKFGVSFAEVFSFFLLYGILNLAFRAIVSVGVCLRVAYGFGLGSCLAALCYYLFTKIIPERFAWF